MNNVQGQAARKKPIRPNIAGRLAKNITKKQTNIYMCTVQEYK